MAQVPGTLPKFNVGPENHPGLSRKLIFFTVIFEVLLKPRECTCCSTSGFLISAGRGHFQQNPSVTRVDYLGEKLTETHLLITPWSKYMAQSPHGRLIQGL